MTSAVVPLLVAFLVAGSALAKIRVDVRAGSGVAIPTVVELATAVLLGLVPLAGVRVPPAALAGAFSVSVWSSLLQARRYRRARKRRDETEGGRLAAYVKYLSEAESDDDSEGDAPP